MAVRTLGCKVNRAESEALVADLVGRGAVLAETDAADVVVINTCTVTAEADAKARKAVRQALQAPGAPVVVVTGCLAATDAAALQALGERVVVEADKDALGGRVAALAGLDDAPHSQAVRSGEGFRTRVALKIEDGCDNFCAYCIVPHARGVPRGLALSEAVAQSRALVDAGLREIVLTGINIGRYRDAETGADLAGLVEAVAATGIERLRLSSIEPPDLTPRLLEALAATPATCAHLHVPLQSGSDAVLSAMGRRYTAEQFAARIDAAREALPGLAVTTDVLVAFPGESEADAVATLELCERVGFSKLHVFRYSARPGTPAAEIPGRIEAGLAASRASELRELGERLRAAYVTSRVGGRAEVLVERVSRASADAPERAEGTTRDYLRVRVDAPGIAEGDLIDVELARDGFSGLLGRVVAEGVEGRGSTACVVESSE